MTDILGVFAKWPEPGRVKTRLAEATSAEFAARIADTFLQDALDRLAAVAVERWLAFAPAANAADFRVLVADRYQRTPQGDGDLGARMERFIRERIEGGAERIVIVGTDSPTLPVECITDAFRGLRDADVVLGPATDGGYYLVGCRRRLPPIFDGIAWGGSTVLRDTIARLEASWRVTLLPPWYDVDTLEDLRMLQGHIAAMRRAGINPGAPRTEQICDVLEGS